MTRAHHVLTLMLLLASGQAVSCGGDSTQQASPAAAQGGDRDNAVAARGAERERMVARQLAARDIVDQAVLRAMRRVPRHLFVPAPQQAEAYDDHPLPIGHGQTISQPYIVALMSQLADVQPGERVLEVGTGSGYQAAVLAELGARVYSIEIIEPLGRRARALLSQLGYDAVQVRIGDGYAGWPSRAPFDAIIVTAAPPEIPAPLLEQLADGGKLVAPVGDRLQDLIVVSRSGGELHRRSVAPVRFVPMTGEAQRR